MTRQTPNRRLVLITGPSGAGLSTAGVALEDAGFEAIDNLPLRMVKPLLSLPGNERPMSLGIDTRNRDFSCDGLLELISDLAADPALDLQHVYLDCRAEELVRRYSTTRRPHPITHAPSVTDVITMEKQLLRPIRARADILIDSSDLNPHELRAEIQAWLVPDGQRQSAVQLLSFSYKRGLPRGADLVLDCRFLRNPHWEIKLRPLDGRNEAVKAYIHADPRYAVFFEQVRDLALFLLPAVQEEGKSYISIAFGCTGGRHRSVALTEALAAELADRGWQVSIRHREVDRTSVGEEAEP